VLSRAVLGGLPPASGQQGQDRGTCASVTRCPESTTRTSMQQAPASSGCSGARRHQAPACVSGTVLLHRERNPKWEHGGRDAAECNPRHGPVSRRATGGRARRIRSPDFHLCHGNTPNQVGDGARTRRTDHAVTRAEAARRRARVSQGGATRASDGFALVSRWRRACKKDGTGRVALGASPHAWRVEAPTRAARGAKIRRGAAAGRCAPEQDRTPSSCSSPSARSGSSGNRQGPDS